MNISHLSRYTFLVNDKINIFQYINSFKIQYAPHVHYKRKFEINTCTTRWRIHIPSENYLVAEPVISQHFLVPFVFPVVSPPFFAVLSFSSACWRSPSQLTDAMYRQSYFLLGQIYFTLEKAHEVKTFSV